MTFTAAERGLVLMLLRMHMRRKVKSYGKLRFVKGDQYDPTNENQMMKLIRQTLDKVKRMETDGD